MAYLQPNTIVTTTDSIGMEPVERERRKKAVQKFLARAEVSMVRVLSLSNRNQRVLGCCDGGTTLIISLFDRTTQHLRVSFDFNGP
jgi:hypothetical protein